MSPHAHRELAHRAGGGIEVTLYWSADDDSTHIVIQNTATDETLAFTVAPGSALDAFYHPFAHLPIVVAGGVPAVVRS